MTIADNIQGRTKAQLAIELLMADLSDHEVQAAMKALRSHADSILGPPIVEPQLSTMSPTEAKAFLGTVCRYSAYAGVLWRNVPKGYIATLADFGLELQRYLRSELGKQHAG